MESDRNGAIRTSMYEGCIMVISVGCKEQSDVFGVMERTMVSAFGSEKDA